MEKNCIKIVLLHPFGGCADSYAHTDIDVKFIKPFYVCRSRIKFTKKNVAINEQTAYLCTLVGFLLLLFLILRLRLSLGTLPPAQSASSSSSLSNPAQDVGSRLLDAMRRDAMRELFRPMPEIKKYYKFIQIQVDTSSSSSLSGLVGTISQFSCLLLS